MKTIYLLRHAHADPQGPGLSDFDRPINEEGYEEAQSVADYIIKKGYTIDFVKCSAALRCQETFEPIRAKFKPSEIDISQVYYNISEDKILSYLRETPDEAQSVLYIGHNPGVAFSILKLAKKIPDFLKEGIKPATFVAFQVSIGKWSDLNWQQGDITDIYHPETGFAESPEPMKS